MKCYVELDTYNIYFGIERYLTTLFNNAVWNLKKPHKHYEFCKIGVQKTVKIFALVLFNYLIIK